MWVANVKVPSGRANNDQPHVNHDEAVWLDVDHANTHSSGTSGPGGVDETPSSRWKNILRNDPWSIHLEAI